MNKQEILDFIMPSAQVFDSVKTFYTNIDGKLVIIKFEASRYREFECVKGESLDEIETSPQLHQAVIDYFDI